MKIRVDFYKLSGKWAYGGGVEIGETHLWEVAFLQAIVNNQEILHNGWQGRYDVVTNDLYENWRLKEYTGFFKNIFKANKFAGLKKQVNK